ncbi:MAG: hypothetical protein ACRDTO_07760 [Mycobacterium sp.]
MNVVRFERDGKVGSIVPSNPPHNWRSGQFVDELAGAVHRNPLADVATEPKRHPVSFLS